MSFTHSLFPTPHLSSGRLKPEDIDMPKDHWSANLDKHGKSRTCSGPSEKQITDYIVHIILYV